MSPLPATQQKHEAKNIPDTSSGGARVCAVAIVWFRPPFQPMCVAGLTD